MSEHVTRRPPIGQRYITRSDGTLWAAPRTAVWNQAQYTVAGEEVRVAFWGPPGQKLVFTLYLFELQEHIREHSA